MAEKIPEELKLLNEWKTRLSLQDWLIVLETNVKPENMMMKDSDGCVSYEESCKAAKIQIVNPKIFDESLLRLRKFDFEEILVHELLHIKFCLLERGKKWEKKLQMRLLHQIIDDTARALVSTKRENK